MALIDRDDTPPHVWERDKREYDEAERALDAYFAKLEQGEAKRVHESECVLCGCVMAGSSGVCASCYVQYAQVEPDYGWDRQW